MKKNIFLALDFNSLEKALDTTNKLKDQIAGVKIGTELYAICGAEGLKKIRDLGVEIFLDLKLGNSQVLCEEGGSSKAGFQTLFQIVFSISIPPSLTFYQAK